MRLALPDTAQSFLLPQYGSVVLLTPPSDDLPTYHLSSEALILSFHLFTQHLYALLALPPLNPKVEASPYASLHSKPNDLMQPITPWQIEQIWRLRTRENSLEARKTLAGIMRLVKKLKEMKLGEGVRGKVLGSVERLERVRPLRRANCVSLTRQLDRTSDPFEAFVLSRDAVLLANEAFFDPSMMGLLYFVSWLVYALPSELTLSRMSTRWRFTLLCLDPSPCRWS